MRDLRWIAAAMAVMAVAAMAQEAEGEQAATGEEAAGACSFAAVVPWTWKAPIDVDLSQRIQVKQDNPLATHTLCKCPAEKAGDVSTTCECTGQQEDDCDAYSRIMAYIVLFMERFMGVILHINEYSKKYHIENVLFWTILGNIFFWFGIAAILYSEIKAVIIARERDERDRLVSREYLKRDEMKCEELEAREIEATRPRPYLTMTGFALFWIGLMCQLTPFCGILGMIFPGLEFFQGFCFLFVVVGTFTLSLSAFFLVIGLCWSCTRGYAALVFIVLGLLGDLVMFGGFWFIVAWWVLSAVVLYVYFSWAPDSYNSPYLQDLGNFYKPSHDVNDWMDAARKGGESFQAETVDLVKNIPGGKEAVEAGDKVFTSMSSSKEETKETASGSI